MAKLGRERRVRFTLPEVTSRRSFSSVGLVPLPTKGRLSTTVHSLPLPSTTPAYSSQSLHIPAVTIQPQAPIPQVTYRQNVRRATMVHVSPVSNRIEQLKNRHIVIITEPTRNTTSLPIAAMNGYNRISVATICNRFSRLMLAEDIIASKPPPVIVPLEAPPPSFISTTIKPDVVVTKPLKREIATIRRRIAKSLFSADTNSHLVADLINRWHRMRYREKLQSRKELLSHHQLAKTNQNESDFESGPQQLSDKKQHQSLLARNDPPPPPSVLISSRLRSDANRFSCLKMSVESDPSVTTLLRAAREADEELLKIVLRKILIDGISKESLNGADKSGRTAISYICSTNLTHFLDILLQIPGIDINKPDNEGNTPLHFAAQAGQADAVNMLITRSRSLQIDAKNELGFTPLMKAALQGRTRCAKLLLFAGASPIETDYGRGLRAEQWATFCGRLSCAEMLEKCARARLLEKTQSCRSDTEFQKVPVTRSKTATIQTQITESFRAKFRKFLPFGTSMKEKQNIKDVRVSNSNTDLVGYLKSATICASGPALPSEGKAQIFNNITKQFEVPKLEVTPANNQQLIKKYEAKLMRDQQDIPMVKASGSIRY